MEHIILADVEFIAFEFAKRKMTQKESIPDFGTRYPNILESCLATPFQRFSKKYVYPGLHRKAAILFYLMIKNHPFQNGNKRLAVTSLLVFLHKNGKWLAVDTIEFYEFAVWVAQSNRKVKDDVVNAIETFVKDHIEDY